MKKLLLVAVLVAGIVIIPAYSESHEKITISIDGDGKTKVTHNIDTQTLLSNILVTPVSENISRVIAFDENNVLLKVHQNENQIRVDSLGASQVILSYEADIVTKDTKIWKIAYSSDSQTIVELPASAQILSFNKIPLDIVNDEFVMPQGEISISFVVQPLRVHQFTVHDESDHILTLITSSNIGDFSYNSKNMKFDVDDNVPIMMLLPKSALPTPYEIFFNNEKTNYKEFNQNATHYWIRLDPKSAGTFAVMSSGEQKIKSSQPVESVSMPTEKSGCLIATAAYGSELAPQVQMLREIRDNVLFGTSSGTAFMSEFNEFYYSFSPVVADLERQSPLLKAGMQTVLAPMLATLSILNYVDIDSEQEMLGYGIGIILLNVGTYFVIPVIVILKITRKIKNCN